MLTLLQTVVRYVHTEFKSAGNTSVRKSQYGTLLFTNCSVSSRAIVDSNSQHLLKLGIANVGKHVIYPFRVETLEASV